jgi:methylenetetrahydrofolate--tRNA-(uracil-5-)-methyltransferase
MSHQIHIIGGGMAGSEAAWQLARRGFRVRLSEMRGSGETTAAHQGDGLAELVCSNSFRSDDDEKNAVGLLHHEMRRCDSLIMAAADKARVPAGSALAVDRDVFSAAVEAALRELPNLELVRERVDTLPSEGMVIVATGPLTAASLASSIGTATGAESLAFFDAIAPIVYRDSIDMDVCWMASRWDKAAGPESTGKDYINCPMDKDQYQAFRQGLLDGEKTVFKEWEPTPLFRRLHADRGHGRARRGHLALRPDEAGGAGRPAHRALALCRGAAAPGQQAGHAVEHGRLPDQAQACRAGAAVPHHSRPGKCRVRAPWRAAPQHLHPFAHAAGPAVAPEIGAAHPLCRADHRLRRLCRKRLGRHARGPDGRHRTGRAGLDAAAGHHRAGRLAGPYHRRCRGRYLSADERELRPVPPVDPAIKKKVRKEAYTTRAKADIAPWVASLA